MEYICSLRMQGGSATVGNNNLGPPAGGSPFVFCFSAFAGNPEKSKKYQKQVRKLTSEKKETPFGYEPSLRFAILGPRAGGPFLMGFWQAFQLVSDPFFGSVAILAQAFQPAF